MAASSGVVAPASMHQTPAASLSRLPAFPSASQTPQQEEGGLPAKKHVRKGERKPPVYSSPLPPCKICGGKASGLHYGVNTCEACKGFFRRAIKFQRKYRCFRQQRCDVVGGRSVRTSCPFCRLQKCLDMGMAHSAIKTGRYTHAKRTENIMEVKRLELYPPDSTDEKTLMDYGGGYGSCSDESRENGTPIYGSISYDGGSSLSNDASVAKLMREPDNQLSHLEFRASCSPTNGGIGVTYDSENSTSNTSLNKDVSGDLNAAMENYKNTVYDEDDKTRFGGRLTSFSRSHGNRQNVSGHWSSMATKTYWASHAPDKPELSFFDLNRGRMYTSDPEEQPPGHHRNSHFCQDQHCDIYNPLPENQRHSYDHQILKEERGDQYYTHQSQHFHNDSHHYHTHCYLHDNHYQHQQMYLHHRQHHRPQQQRPFFSHAHNEPLQECHSQQLGHSAIPQTSRLTESCRMETAMSVCSDDDCHGVKCMSCQPGGIADTCRTHVPVHQYSVIPGPIKVESWNISGQTFKPRANYKNTCLTETSSEGVCIAIPSPPLSHSMDDFDGVDTENYSAVKVGCDESKHVRAIATESETILSSDPKSTPNFAAPPLIYVGDPCKATSKDHGCSARANGHASGVSITAPEVSVSSSTALSLALPASPSLTLSPSTGSSPSPSMLASVLETQTSQKEADILSLSIPSTQTPPVSMSSILSMIQFPSVQQVSKIGTRSAPRFSGITNLSTCHLFNYQVSNSITYPEKPPVPLSKPPVYYSERAVSVVVAAYRKHTITLMEHDPDFLYQWQLSYWKQQRARLETFGLKTEFVKDELYEEIFEQTGLDIDNRKEHMDIIHGGALRYFKSLTLFALELPGFASLPTEDQVVLVYESYLEQWFLNAFFGVNKDLSVMIMPMGQPYTKSELSWVVNEQFAEVCFDIAPSFKALRVDKTIMALWKAVVLFSADHSPLKDDARVTQLQLHYLDLLKQYTCDVYPRDPRHLGRIVDATVRLRDLGHHTAPPRSFTASSVRETITEILASGQTLAGLADVKEEEEPEPSCNTAISKKSENVSDEELEEEDDDVDERKPEGGDREKGLNVETHHLQSNMVKNTGACLQYLKF